VLAGIPFDVNDDGFVDLADYLRLARCLAESGPQEATGFRCRAVRFDADSDVDLADVAGFQNAFTGPAPPGFCGDGMVNGSEECDTGGESATCNANCTTSRCGDGIPNAMAGEQCDDGNHIPGDGCSATCRNEASNLPNDDCAAAINVSDGTTYFNNLGATTDGPDEPSVCNFFNQTQIESDLWYCYTATCTGTATISLCGSDYDTKLAVYSGCRCPRAAATACSEDACGSGVERMESRLEIPVTAGSKYRLRVGAFENAQGVGRLTIGCNVDACASGTGDCFVPSPSQAPGCGNATCCTNTCDLDKFCCDVTWDVICAGEAQGICSGHFPACAAGSGSCGVVDVTPGCDDESCCDAVCRTDPFCCLTTWDAACVNEAQTQCLLSCGRDAGECGTTHTSPGCNDQTCCALVCDAVDGDPFCCNTEWDQVCVDLAVQNCP